jgi:hypothetical protein
MQNRRKQPRSSHHLFGKTDWMARSLILSLLCVLVFTETGGAEPFGLEQPARGASVLWEPKPRFVRSGNDAQLDVRTSEALNMIYAAQNQENKQDLFYSGSRDMGDTFSTPIRINTEAGEVAAHGENGPQLRMGYGIYVAWEGNKDIKFSRSSNFGKSFAPAIKVNDDTGDDSQSFLTMEVAPDGTIFIAWLDGRDKQSNLPGTSSLYIARSKNKGASFEKNIRITGDVCPCCRPSIAFGDSGEVFIAWRHVFAENERIIAVASSADGGTSWAKPVPVTANGWKIKGCAHAGPVMKHVAGKLVVAWYTAEDGHAGIKVALSSDSGQTFAPTREIQGEVLDSNHPHMTVLEKEVWIVFQGRDPNVEGGWGLPKAWLARVPADGGAIHKPEPLPMGEKGVFYPHLFVGTGGRLYATWTEFEDNGLRVILCRGRIRS